MSAEIDPVKKIEYRYENCGEGYGAPSNFVEVTVYESGKVEKKLVDSKDDQKIKI